MIRVLVADDQRVVREGLSLLLGLVPDVDVVATAPDGNAAVQLAVRLQPDIVLMDLRMPHCDGIEATRRLATDAPAVKVVVLTTYADDQSVLAALRAGARGYLTKDVGRAELERALTDVQRDRAALDPAVQRHVIVAAGGTAPTTGTEAVLTARERQVLELIAAGMSNAEIAGRLVISEATVKTHVTHILGKIGARDRAHAVACAYRDRLL